MNGLYRCRCAVGYRPYTSDKLILFSEKQVVSASVNLQWDPNGLVMNADAMTEATQFVTALSGSTASITLSDPYMTGVAWAALFDSAAAYTNTSHAAANHIMLPACKEGESPESNLCRRFQEIEDPRLRKSGFGDFAHILVTYYYEVAGTKVALDTYFRLQSFSIKHGKSYPQVSLQGVDPQVVAFNQSLGNFQFEENKSLEENLKNVVEELGYTPSFCTDPTDTETKKYIMPRSFKERNITAGEMIKKYLSSVGGSSNSLPVKEYAKKISLCTRANVNQGCSVFYLGKGLYEGYTITGQVPTNLLNLNLENDLSRGLGYNYDKLPLRENKSYTIDEIYKEKRNAKLKDARTDLTSFPNQFETLNKRFSDNQTGSGYVWNSAGPQVTTEKKKKTNFHGIGINGDAPISFLDGIVASVAKDGGLIIIATNYFLRYCDENKKCRNSVIMQETVNLSSIEERLRKVGAPVEMNEQVGTATSEKPEFTRFYISAISSSDKITLSPALVWKYAVPVKPLTDQEKKDIDLRGDKPSGPVSNSGQGSVIGRVGNTGRSTNPHLHAEYEPPRPITKEDLEGIIEIGGKPPSFWKETSGYGAQEEFRTKPHNGVDLAGDSVDINNQPITLLNGKIIATGSESGFGNYVVIDTPKGKILLAHLADGSTKGVQGTSSSVGSKYGTGVQGAPAVNGAEISTEFKGVPRALRIVPGRTILSLITNYDEWVEQGRPSTIDPEIWIADRFSKWFVKSARYQWGKGDLRVSITGITDWGNTTARILVPSFEDYMSSGDFNVAKDYYGYIRSVGDLCWRLKDGKTSCEVFCSEAQKIENFLKAGRSGSKTSVNSQFPPANCQYRGTKYPPDKVNAIINAAKQAGINTKAGYAGVVGNALVESGTNLDPAIENIEGSGAFGIFQWKDSRRANLEKFARESGRSASDFSTQMSFFVAELNPNSPYYDSTSDAAAPGGNLAQAMNSAKSPEEAAALFNAAYERAPGQGEGPRQNYAIEIFSEMDCVEE